MLRTYRLRIAAYLTLALFAVLFPIPTSGDGYTEILLENSEGRHTEASSVGLDLQVDYRFPVIIDDLPTVGTIHENDVITGDHIVINGTVTSTPIGSNVTSMLLHIEAMDRIKFNTTAPLVIPNPSYNPYDGIIDQSQFAWVIVKGLARGVLTSILCDFTNSDTDLFGWPGHIKPSEYSFSNNLFSGLWGHPITKSFTWEYENDTLVFGIFDYDLQLGEFYLEVEQEAEVINIVNDASWVMYDTYNICRNITALVIFNVTLDLGLTYTYRFKNVTFNNFFAPRPDLLSPIGGEDWSTGTHNITWTATDRNADDELFFRIRFSNDGGQFWQLLGSGPMIYDPVQEYYYYTWTTTALIPTDRGVLTITAYDNDTQNAGTLKPFRHDLTPSIWPGFKGEDSTDSLFSFGSATIGPPPDIPEPIQLSIGVQDDITMYVDEPHKQIVWQIACNYNTTYAVFRNVTRIKH